MIDKITFSEEELYDIDYVLEVYIDGVGIYPDEPELHSRIKKIYEKLKEAKCQQQQ